MMHLWKHQFVGLLLASAAIAAEDPIVSDGLTITDWLTAGGDSTSARYATALTGAFTTVSSSPTVTVTHTSHGKSIGQKISFYGTSATVGGLTMDGAWTIATTPTGNTYTFTHTSNASSTVSTPTGNTTATYSAIGNDGKLRFLCLFSHLAYDDPIVNPGVAGAAHLHLFFGNTTTDANSTYASLRAAGNGTCDGGPLNRTAYWMPAMLDSALQKVRIPLNFQWYYTMTRRDLVAIRSQVCDTTGLLQDGRAAACPMVPIKKIERGMKAIFGFKPTTGGYPTSYVGPNADILASAWTCLDSGGNSVGAAFYRYLSHRSTPALGLTSDVNCPSSGIVSLRVDSPQCWDGTHDSTDHYTHFAPTGNDGFGVAVCPDTHQNAFYQFTVISSWTYSGGISSAANWYLASDRHNGANYEAGESFHWDMLWAWNDTIQEHFHEHTHGESPSSATGAPYVYGGTTGGTANTAGQWAGGPFMRDMNNGGMGGVSSGGSGADCSGLGMGAVACNLKDHTTLGVGITDVLVDIPGLRRRGKMSGKSR